MGQLEPGSSESVRALLRMLQEAARDLLVSRVEAQREVAGQHRRRTLGAAMRIGHGVGAGTAPGLPLMRTRRTLGQFPFVTKQVFEEVVAPFGWLGGPSHFQP